LSVGDDRAPGLAGTIVGVRVEAPLEAAEVEGETTTFGLKAAEAGIGTTTEEGGKAGWSGTWTGNSEIS
jgi:hypothetical protein